MEDTKRDLSMPEGYKYIAAFVTMRCNLKCKFCLNAFSEGFERNRYTESSGENWIRGLNRINPQKGLPVTVSGGEPLMHPDFTEIINGINPSLEIDILTNLSWEKGLEKFIERVPAKRLKRDARYPSIRASYHPEQMGNGEELIRNVKRMKDAGFDVGVYSVLYPSPEHLQAITQMQFRCANEGILFRVKDFTGIFDGKIYGDYSKYLGAAFSERGGSSFCKTSELIIGPNLGVYKCHRDLYSEENSIGNLLDFKFRIKGEFRGCNNYGNCHPCDVKVKTNYMQNLGHTSVEIVGVKKNESKNFNY